MTTVTSGAMAPGDLVGAVRREVETLRRAAPDVQAGDWSREDRERVIGELDTIVTDLTLYRSRLLLAHREAGRWGSVQDRDFADWRSRVTGAGRGAAMGDVQLAEGLAAMPVVAEAVERGELNLEHARTLGRVHRGASEEVKRALDEGGMELLVERAAEEQLSAPDLGTEVKAWAARIDAQAAQDQFNAVRRRRSVTMRKRAGGVAGEFFLDPVAGEELRTALEAITGRPAQEDERTREQRMADALSTMASRTLQVGADLTGAQVRPHLALLVTQDTWVGVLARRLAFDSCPTDRRPPLPHVPPGQLEDGTIVPLGELERLVCDCEVTRMVMDAAGVPLDVGQTQRTYTKELRRAIITRDRHCQWPGCRLRASWCEVHHITWFSRGGHTSLEEGLTACTFHHHRIHERDVQITVLPHGFDFHDRDGTHIGTTHRAATPDIRLPDTAAGCQSPAAPSATASAASWATAPSALAATPLDVGAAPASAAPPAPLDPGAAPAPGEQRASTRSARIRLIGPVPPSTVAGPRVASTGPPLPSLPSSYATAPPTLWDSDPPR